MKIPNLAKDLIIKDVNFFNDTKMEKLHSKKMSQFDLKVFVSGDVWYMINALFNDGLSTKPALLDDSPIKLTLGIKSFTGCGYKGYRCIKVFRILAVDPGEQQQPLLQLFWTKTTSGKTNT